MSTLHAELYSPLNGSIQGTRRLQKGEFDFARIWRGTRLSELSFVWKSVGCVSCSERCKETLALTLRTKLYDRMIINKLI